MSKKTLVLGASSNPERYSYKAISFLLNKKHPVVAVGNKEDETLGVSIKKEMPEEKDQIDTITLYLSSKNQVPYYDSIIDLKPKRVIFNPGTYNPELIEKLEKNNIETVEACTLVMLSTNTY